MIKIEVKKVKFNTLNAWGFAGCAGTCTYYADGSFVRKGKAYYRHLPATSFIRYYNKDGKEVSKKEFNLNGE